MRVRVDPKGRIVIQVSVRRAFGIKARTPVHVESHEYEHRIVTPITVNLVQSL